MCNGWYSQSENQKSSAMRHSFWCSVCMVLVLMLVHSLAQQQGSEVQSDFGINTWQKYMDFLLLYNSQWPFRRLTIVYSTSTAYLKMESRTREELRVAKAQMEASLTMIERNMARTFSKNGVSLSTIRLPTQRGSSTVVDMLRLKDPAPQPPVTVALLGPDNLHASFIREVSEAGGLIGNKVSWIVISPKDGPRNNDKLLTADLGLRPDSNVLAVNLNNDNNPGGTTQRWSGSGLEANIQWGLQLKPQSGPGGNLETTGQRISVAVFQDYPFIYTDKNTGIHRGWFIEVWNEIQSRLKFNTSFYVPTSHGSATLGLFKRATEELRQGRADVVLAPFILTEVDMEECDFSAPVTTIKYRLYVQRATTTSSLLQFIQPFSTRLWASAWGTVMIAMILMTLTYMVGRYLNFELDGAPLFDVRESILIIFGSLLQQGPDFSPEGIGGRIILWCSYAFGLVMYTAYGAALISKLTVRTVDPPFHTLEEMLASNYLPYMLPDSVSHRLTQTAEKGAWRDLRDRRPRYVLIRDLSEGIQAAAYGSRTVLLAARERTLHKIQTRPLNCQIAQLPATILNSPGSFILQKNSPFKSAIDQQLLQMWSSGRLARYRERWMALVIDDPCPADATLPQFGLLQVTLPFLIFFVGIGIGFILLLMECAAYRWFRTHDAAVTSAPAGNVRVRGTPRNRPRRNLGPPPQNFLH